LKTHIKRTTINLVLIINMHLGRVRLEGEGGGHTTVAQSAPHKKICPKNPVFLLHRKKSWPDPEFLLDP
jgi:hypothetical protein